MTTRTWLMTVAVVALLSAGGGAALAIGTAGTLTTPSATAVSDGSLSPAAPAQQPALPATAASSQPASDVTTLAQAAQPAPEPQRVVPASKGDVQLSFAPIVKQVAPAVVNVYATTVTQASASPFAGDPFFERFFGGASPFGTRPRTSQSLGSGVIIDKSGLILTNSHVVHGATDIHITLSDGHEYAVKIVLDDTKTDLAALRVTDKLDRELPTVTFADSDKLEVGDLVLAIGNPFGVGQTVTSGIVSALARTGVEVSDYSFFIQTDAAINPGNSGGALVDMDGKLVGINSAIFSNSSTGGSVGIGFAIPVNMAALIAHAAETGKQVVHAWFGAHLQALDTDLARNLKLDVPRGALVTDLAPGGPADKAGFKSGDVIIDVDGKPVDDPKAFNFRLATKPIGGTADMTVMRDGKKMHIKLGLVGSPADDPATQVVVKANNVFSGITAAELSPALAEEYGQPYDAKGVVIRNVAQGSRSDAVGFKPGDIILNLNGTDIRTKDDFARATAGTARNWQIVFERNGKVSRAYLSG